MIQALRIPLAVLWLAAPAAADETPAMQAFHAGVTALQDAMVKPTLSQQQAGWRRAEAEFRKAVELKTDYADAYNKLGLALFNQQRVFEAITELRKAVAINPRLTEAWYHLGFAYENIGLEKRVAADEKTRRRLERSAPGDAKAAYRKAVAVDPPNDLNARARSHYRLGVLLRDAPQPSGAVPAVAAGKAQAPERNLREAMLHLEKANQLLTDFPEARNELGRLYDMIGRYPEAIEQYDLAIRGHKLFAEAYSNRGVAWWKLGNWDKALEDTRRATEIDPRFAGGRYNFGQVIFARVQELRLKGDEGDRAIVHLEAQKAVDEFRIATELDPTFIPAWYGLAKAYHGYHDYENAAKTYERILEIDRRQRDAKALLRALRKEQQAYQSHIPKQYRQTQGR